MEHRVTGKYLATMGAECVGKKELLWHSQLYLSPSSQMLRLNKIKS
jgi:hypothetical protein